MRKGGTLRQAQRGELEGWRVEKLGDVCDIVNGSTPLRSNKSFWENGDISWFTIDDIRTQGRKITETKQKVTRTALEVSSLRMLPINSVLLCCTASIGEYAITEIPLATNQQFNGLVVKNQKLLSPYFLFHYCATLKDKLLNLSGKTTIDFIPISRLREIEIPIPPLPEQQRIVSVLDEAFASIAQAKSNAERNLVNARELFESALAKMYENAGEHWEEKNLGDIASEMQTGPFGSTLHKSDYVANGIPVINPQNIVDGKIVPLQKMMVNQKTKERLSRYILQEKDIVLARRGEMGRCAIVEKEQAGWLCGSGSFVVRIKKEVDANYLVRYLSSEKVKRILQKGSVGTTMDNLNQGILSQVPVPFPPLAEQRAIVGRLEALSAETGRLEEIYQQKVESLEELKKSVLAKAFEGLL